MMLNKACSIKLAQLGWNRLPGQDQGGCAWERAKQFALFDVCLDQEEKENWSKNINQMNSDKHRKNISSESHFSSKPKKKKFFENSIFPKKLQTMNNFFKIYQDFQKSLIWIGIRNFKTFFLINYCKLKQKSWIFEFLFIFFWNWWMLRLGEKDWIFLSDLFLLTFHPSVLKPNFDCWLR